MSLREVELSPLSLSRFIPLVGHEAVEEALSQADRVRKTAGLRRLWCVNSTAFGGGVAEMLRPLLSYAKGAGIDARWVVIDGPSEFFRVTKRLHNALHGEAGDRHPLGRAERQLFEAVSAANAADLILRVRPGDIVLLHDPQTAGLAPHLLAAQVKVIWRCHIGRDQPNAEAELGWRFLLPYLRPVPLSIFSRWAYIPPELNHGRSVVVPPSIDPFSPKNAPLSDEQLFAIVTSTGLVGAGDHARQPAYERSDRTRGVVEHFADLVSLGGPPPQGTPLVVQVSRWDTLKDPVGVMLGFARLVEQGQHQGAHLMLAGPNVHSVADDPDGARVFGETFARWRELPHEVRRCVHLAMLPTHDRDENAVIVNALQRYATVVVQKSLAEGFGLTVTEAMWKARPVVATATGGIQDQIMSGVNGVLLPDPNDLDAFGAILAHLLSSPREAQSMGVAAHEHVKAHFLALRHLRQYGDLIERLDAEDARAHEEAPVMLQ